MNDGENSNGAPATAPVPPVMILTPEERVQLKLRLIAELRELEFGELEIERTIGAYTDVYALQKLLAMCEVRDIEALKAWVKIAGRAKEDRESIEKAQRIHDAEKSLRLELDALKNDLAELRDVITEHYSFRFQETTLQAATRILIETVRSSRREGEE